MKSIELLSFFLGGGSGTNDELASMFGTSRDSIRVMIQRIRKKHNVAIEKVLPVRKGKPLHAVYRRSLSTDPIAVVRGRPAHCFKHYEG